MIESLTIELEFVGKQQLGKKWFLISISIIMVLKNNGSEV